MAEVDWDAVERQERRRDLLAAPLLVGWFAGIVLLTGWPTQFLVGLVVAVTG